MKHTDDLDDIGADSLPEDAADSQRLLLDTAHRQFAGLCDKALLDSAEQGHYPAALAASLADHGLHRLAEPDSGFALADVFAVLKVAGYHALPIPLAEWMLANRWLENSSDGLVSIGHLRDSVLMDVPWGQQAHRCLGVTPEGELFRVQPGQWQRGSSIAGEPRDSLLGATLTAVSCSEHPFELLALARCSLAVGAMQRLLELVIEQVTLREQFGRPLARFQVIQHAVAGVAAEVAVAGKAHDATLSFLDTDRQREEVAVACARICESTGVVTDAVHQLFGAIGFTHEHILHHYTRRLWLWREDFGNERYWQQALGESICARGPEQLWPFIASDR